MEIVQIAKDNVDRYDHCLIKNKKAPGYIAKSGWILERLKDGLIIKRALIENETAGFIEYIPIEKVWRAVEGKNYLFIHCIFTYPKKHQAHGVAAKLIEDCIDEAQKKKKDGVAVITSKGSFIADERIFAKSGFKKIAELNKHELMVFRINPKAQDPKFKDIEAASEKYNGIHMFYTDQCPSLAKPVEEIIEVSKNEKIDLNVHYIKSAKEAQNAPFVSGTFGIVVDGTTHAERVVSKTRFLNIVKKSS